MCLLLAILNGYFNDSFSKSHFYLSNTDNIAYEAFLAFFSYFLLLNTFLPISLIVSLEFVKFFQAKFIHKDKAMFTLTNKKHVKVFSSSINEELGQI